MDKQLAGNFTFTIDAFRMTKNGGVKITLSVGEDQAPKALALALHTDAFYEADVFLLENQTFGSTTA